MRRISRSRFASRPPRGTSGLIAVGLAVVVTLASCSVVRDIKKVEHLVKGNKATIDGFTNKVQSSEGTTFEATYVTTGSSPATIVYAVEPSKDLAFQYTPSGSGREDIVVNSSGEYACSAPSGSTSSTAWSCNKLNAADAANENKIFSNYTPAHWVTFLKDFSLAAGFAGDKVTSSSMTVNGFNMQCVDFVASGVPGTSTICSTSQGLLGYVKVASDSTSFEITNYSSSPSSSLFELPAGAQVTTGTS